MRCAVCPRHCDIPDGGTGACGARTSSGARITCSSFGEVTALHLDPIEKKPLAMFLPGSRILSVGSWGCNLRCPWCQNDSISRGRTSFVRMEPEELAEEAEELRPAGNVGLAFTYNEPLIRPEFVIETGQLIRSRGMVNVLVTNGMAEEPVFRQVLRITDALNIDLKTMSESGYRRIGGDLETVKNNIRLAAGVSHVEVTVLIVPGFSDSAENILETARFLADIDPGIPLHVTRFFPAGSMRDSRPTPVRLIMEYADRARDHLRHVFTGNC